MTAQERIDQIVELGWKSINYRSGFVFPPKEVENIKEALRYCCTEGMKLNVEAAPDESYQTIFEAWNAANIRVHKTLNEITKTAMKKALKNYTLDEILQAIKRYGVIVNHPETYRFSYRWSLSEFLSREKGIVQFNDDYAYKNLARSGNWGGEQTEERITWERR